MIPSARLKALAAIAEATGRVGDADVADNRETGVTTLDSPGRPPLRLLEGDIVTTPGVWLFDEQPTVPAGTVPVWRGYLVHLTPHGDPHVVHLGDRLELADAWAELTGVLTPFELASLIGRYFGRDARLPVHHTV